MRDRLELPRLSLAERDRRWQLTRRHMAARGIDCLVLWGWPAMWDFCTANARYLSPIGGNSENNTLVFPATGEPTSYVFMPTFTEYWKRAQDWVQDVRSRRGSWADTVVARIRELGLERGRIGMDGLAGPLDPDGWLPHSVFESIKAALPDVTFIDLGDLLETTRSVKSAEEIAMLVDALSKAQARITAPERTPRRRTVIG
jgi:Xaa-Pro aminopeptidase